MYGSIQKKLILYIVPIVLIVLSLSYHFSMVNSRKLVEHEIYETIDAKHDEQSQLIENELTKFKNNADNFAVSVGSTYEYLDLDIYNKIITTMLSKDTRLRSAGIWFEPYLISPELDYVSTIVENKNGEVTTNNQYYSGAYKYTDNPSYIKCKELNTSFFTEAYYNTFTDSYAITYVTPIQNSNGDFIGCVTTSFNMDQLKVFVDKYIVDDMNFYIISSSGVYIANTDLELVTSQTNILDASDDFVATAKSILSTESGVLNYNKNGENYYIYFDTVSDFGWKLIFEVPESYISKQLFSLTLMNFIICTLSIIIIIFIIYYVSRRFVHKPLQLLLSEFNNISNNNYDSDIPKELAKTNTEFSTIGSAVSEMKLNLVEYQNELENKNKLFIENEHALKESVDYVNTIINALPIMMFVFDRDGNCVEVHGKMPFFNRPNDFYKGKNYSELVMDVPEKCSGLEEFLHTIKTIDYSDGVIKNEVSGFINGNVEYFEHNVTLCRDDVVICLSRKITDTVNLIRDMEYLTDFDELTGLYNSRYFIDMMKNHDEYSDLPISIIVCDINGLNSINDKYGFEAGDNLLIDFTVALNNIDVENKTVARMVEDAFAVILPNTTKKEAEDIIEKINSMCLLKLVSQTPFSIAYGVDTATTEQESLLHIVKRAEDLLYKQKVYTSSGKKDNSVGLINSILHAKNKREQMHSNRVSELCLEMAKALDWSPLEQRKISTAGLLHDIGKIGISETILDKPGKLTDDEYKEICTHPEIGYRILQSFENMKELAEYAYSHHEKWDGTGYPRKLKGDNIPIEARILAIADTYDAMTSSRSYREGLPKQVAVAELIRCKNTQFDPKLVDTFIEKVLNEDLLDYQI